MKTTKKAAYARHGIQYKNGKILSPIGYIPELLKDGNGKTGKAVYTFSILPGTHAFQLEISGELITICGTCVCDCIGCYAKTGRFNTSIVINSMGINTYLVNNYIGFVRNAIFAQLESIGRGEIRIHAAGDFNTANPEEYATM